MDRGIHERLREARLAKGWNQTELAEQVNISQQAVSGYEKDRRPRFDVVIQLCEALEISLDWLVWGEDEPL